MLKSQEIFEEKLSESFREITQLFYNWWVIHIAGIYCPCGSPLDFKERIFGKACLQSRPSCKAAMSGAVAYDIYSLSSGTRRSM